MTVRCFAKINTLLRVLGKRPDGYHNIYTHFQTIDMHDILHFDFEGDAISLSCDQPDLPENEENIVLQAAKLYQKLTGFPAGVKIQLEKTVPVAAGLGGGSSDAAATLRVFNDFNSNPLSQKELAAIALELGSDVPYFLLGGHALGHGRGEVLKRLPEQKQMTLLLVNPGIKIKSSDAYEDFDLTFKARISDIIERDHVSTLRLAENPESTAWHNDLEKGVFANHPELRDLKNDLVTLGAEEALLSGSGSIVVARFRDTKLAKKATDELRNGIFEFHLGKSLSASQFYRQFYLLGNILS